MTDDPATTAATTGSATRRPDLDAPRTIGVMLALLAYLLWLCLDSLPHPGWLAGGVGVVFLGVLARGGQPRDGIGAGLGLLGAASLLAPGLGAQVLGGGLAIAALVIAAPLLVVELVIGMIPIIGGPIADLMGHVALAEEEARLYAGPRKPRRRRRPRPRAPAPEPTNR